MSTWIKRLADKTVIAASPGLAGCAAFLVSIVIAATVHSQTPAADAPGLSLRPDGTLQYTQDEQGNRIPDFSFCGYKASVAPIPDIPVKVVVPIKEGDATPRIQAAIDYVSALPKDKNGFRGAILLEKGIHEIHGSLFISSSGVILRGSGCGTEGTSLIGTGKNRETLIQIRGKDDRASGTSSVITDEYVPVNATTVTTSSSGFMPGDFVTIQRRSTQAWIDQLGMNEFGGEETQWLGWKPGQRDLYWERQIQSISGSILTFDAPITNAIENGVGIITKYQWPGRIDNVGIENVALQSTYDKENPKDEDHRWMAITMENVRDSWVRQVTFKHFAGSAVALFETASRITVEDCISKEPVSEIGGQRRYTFFTSGQQNLFQRIHSGHGYHDFAVGFCTSGLNAFVQCDTKGSFGFSGTTDSWSSGVLFDNVSVDGQPLGFTNRLQEGHGAGWTAANSVLWQCSASRINCFQPPSAYNWSFGAWGEFSGNGIWRESNNHVKPASLFYAQLAERLGHGNGASAHMLPRETEATSSPTVEQALALTKSAATSALTLEQWILDAPRRQSIPLSRGTAKSIDDLVTTKKTNPLAPSKPIFITKGMLIVSNGAATGKRWNVSWWRGDIRTYEIPRSRPHITRFVPGRSGTGFTDDLQEVTDQMKKEGVVAIEHNYGLWYDRRRDDHERVRRPDGDVWPPFYEMPFARSGKETAWDGLSRYDLTQYNPWYWDRLRQFADLADQNGLVLIHKNYFQHNILEAGAHWTDFSWRPANNINETGFPEPPSYAGDKRIFMAEQFYDITHPVRRKLHRDYIRKCLDNFSGNTNVIQIIGEEYTGPLHFVQFWLEVIAEWEKETGKNVFTALSTTKDVQDEILKDKVRSEIVDIIDIRYWHYEESGKAYAPEGGKNLAPRQHARILKPGKTSFEQVYRAVREYRKTFPDKAVIYSGDKADGYAWASFMAGGSLTALPVSNQHFLQEAAQMEPSTANTETNQWSLAGAPGYIIYTTNEKVDVSQVNTTSAYTVRWINPENGKIIKELKNIAPGKISGLTPNSTGAKVLWLSRK